MSVPSRRPNRLPRQAREQRAFQLVVAGGTSGVVALVTGIVALLTPLGWTLPVIAAIVMIACVLLFRRTVGS